MLPKMYLLTFNKHEVNYSCTVSAVRRFPQDLVKFMNGVATEKRTKLRNATTQPLMENSCSCAVNLYVIPPSYVRHKLVNV